MPAYEYKAISVEIEGGVAWVMINRPEKRNAMNPAVHYEMDDVLPRLEHDAEVKVLVIGGKGGHFSAGMDLKEFFRATDGDPPERQRVSEASQRWRWERLFRYAKPTIAMVEGYCVGGAFTQLAGCDFALAAEDAKFSLSEVNWGIVPAGLVAKVFGDLVLPRHALYHACVGKPFDGKEAERIGLINRAVPGAALRDAVRELAHELMLKSPNALRATKHAIRQVRTMSMTDAAAYLDAQYKVATINDSENSYNSGMTQFLDEKSYKPVYRAFRLKDASSEASDS